MLDMFGVYGSWGSNKRNIDNAFFFFFDNCISVGLDLFSLLRFLKIFFGPPKQVLSEPPELPSCFSVLTRGLFKPNISLI